MPKMRWFEGETEKSEFPWVAVLGLLGCALALGGIVYGLIKATSSDNLIQNEISQEDHMKVVRLRPDVMTKLRLDAVHDDKLDFQTCEDYEVVAVKEVVIALTRRVVDVYLNVKRPFILNLNYTGSDRHKTPRFLYVKVEMKSK